jgi:PKD repeat protein
MKPYACLMLAAAMGALVGCNEDGVNMGPLPPAPDFTLNQSDPNNVVFTVTSAQGFMVNWDFGNGTLSKKMVDTVYFAFADTYTVSLAVSGKGGATVTKKEVVITKTDPVICANIYYEYLTGGCAAPSKTWVIPKADSAFGNGGPSPKDSLDNGTSSYNDKIVYWWNSDTAGIPRLPDARSLDDEYIFQLRGFVYKNESHGDFYFNWKWANKLFGATQATFADTIRTYIPNNPAKWELERVAEGDTTGGKRAFFTDSTTGKRFNLLLHFSNDSYIGYGSGTSTYQILSISADKMFLRHELAEPDKPSATGPNRLEWRYLNLVSKK